MVCQRLVVLVCQRLYLFEDLSLGLTELAAKHPPPFLDFGCGLYFSNSFSGIALCWQQWGDCDDDDESLTMHHAQPLQYPTVVLI